MTKNQALSTLGGMTTRIRKGAKPYLYVDEWMAYLGLDDKTIAGRLDRDPSTIWRWRREKRRLSPDKQAELAHAMNIEPERLWRPPEQISVDAMLRDASADVRQMAADIVRRLVQKAS